MANNISNNFNKEQSTLSSFLPNKDDRWVKWSVKLCGWFLAVITVIPAVSVVAFAKANDALKRRKVTKINGESESPKKIQRCWKRLKRVFKGSGKKSTKSKKGIKNLQHKAKKEVKKVKKGVKKAGHAVEDLQHKAKKKAEHAVEDLQHKAKNAKKAVKETKNMIVATTNMVGAAKSVAVATTKVVTATNLMGAFM